MCRLGLIAARTALGGKIGEVTWSDGVIKDTHGDEEEEPPKAAAEKEAYDSKRRGNSREEGHGARVLLLGSIRESRSKGASYGA